MKTLAYALTAALILGVIPLTYAENEEEVVAEIVFAPETYEVYREWAENFVAYQIDKVKEDGTYGTGFASATFVGPDLAWLRNLLVSEAEGTEERVLSVTLASGANWPGHDVWAVSQGVAETIVRDCNRFYNQVWRRRTREAMIEERREELAAETERQERALATARNEAAHPLYGDSLEPVRERLMALDDQRFDLALERARLESRRAAVMAHLEGMQQPAEDPGELAEQMAALEMREEALVRELDLASAKSRLIQERVEKGAELLQAMQTKKTESHPAFIELRAELEEAEHQAQDAGATVDALQEKLAQIRGERARIEQARETASAPRSAWIEEMLVDTEIRAAELDAAEAMVERRQAELNGVREAMAERLREVAEFGARLDELHNELAELRHWSPEIPDLPMPEIRYLDPPAPEPKN